MYPTQVIQFVIVTRKDRYRILHLKHRHLRLSLVDCYDRLDPDIPTQYQPRSGYSLRLPWDCSNDNAGFLHLKITALDLRIVLIYQILSHFPFLQMC